MQQFTYPTRKEVKWLREIRLISTLWGFIQLANPESWGTWWRWKLQVGFIQLIIILTKCCMDLVSGYLIWIADGVHTHVKSDFSQCLGPKGGLLEKVIYHGSQEPLYILTKCTKLQIHQSILCPSATSVTSHTGQGNHSMTAGRLLAPCLIPSWEDRLAYHLLPMVLCL